MPIAAAVNQSLPGSVALNISGAPAGSTVQRLDDAVGVPAYVRNFAPVAGADFVIDCEAPLGRPVVYVIVDANNVEVARSSTVTCPAPASGYSIIRSVLAPQVMWMWAEPADETGVEWASSTRAYPVIGSDTPIVVSEVRQRHTGVMSFYAKTIQEANQIVSICRDGTAILFRHSPCAGKQTRDVTVYPLDIREVRWGRSGGRLVAISYQATRWVPGDTTEPVFDWDFADLRGSASNFQQLTARFASFSDMALNNPRSP